MVASAFAGVLVDNSALYAFLHDMVQALHAQSARRKRPGRITYGLCDRQALLALPNCSCTGLTEQYRILVQAVAASLSSFACYHIHTRVHVHWGCKSFTCRPETCLSDTLNVPCLQGFVTLHILADNAGC